MPVIRHSVAPATLEARVRARLAADGDEALMLDAESLEVRIRDGWLTCDVDARASGGARSTLQVLYFLGRDGDPDDAAASSTVYAVGAGAALAARWGRLLQRAIWHGVLDALEAVLALVGRLNPGRTLGLVGFTGSASGLDVDVEVELAAAA